MLEDLSLQVCEGEWWTIVGPNGAGKSTLAGALGKTVSYEGTITLEGKDIRQIPQLADFVEAIAQEKQLNQSMAMNINLALEEAVSNVMLYAYPEGTDGLVDVGANIDKDALEFVIVDSGVPFDPTAAPEVDLNAPVEQRPIGGLGIHLVRQLMDSVSYERKEDKNYLKMKKYL